MHSDSDSTALVIVIGLKLNPLTDTHHQTVRTTMSLWADYHSLVFDGTSFPVDVLSEPLTPPARVLFPFDVNAGADSVSTKAREYRKAAIKHKRLMLRTKTTYKSRQSIAKQRPRVGGRFVKTKGVIAAA